MTRRILAALVAVFLIAAGALVGTPPEKAVAYNSCVDVPHCFATDLWYVAVGDGVDGGSAKLKICENQSATNAGPMTKMWVTLPDSEVIEGGMAVTADGSMELYTAWTNNALQRQTIHGATYGKYASFSHYYYVTITQDDTTPSYWLVQWYDASNLQLVWGVLWPDVQTGAHAQQLRVGGSALTADTQTYGSATELQFLNVHQNWVSGWGTASNPGNYTGFYYGDTSANPLVAWNSAYTSLKFSMNHANSGCN